jgi:hypothetical protein
LTHETCFRFIINHLEVRFDPSLHIEADYYFRKATAEQVGSFREFLSSLIGFKLYRELNEFPYELSHVRVDDNNSDYYSRGPLERDHWKYDVISWEPAES